MSELKKKDLIDAVAIKAALKRSEAKEAVEIVLAQMADAMAKGDMLILPPFGKLQILQSKDVDGAKIMKAKIRQPKQGGGAKPQPVTAAAAPRPAAPAAPRAPQTHAAVPAPQPPRPAPAAPAPQQPQAAAPQRAPAAAQPKPQPKPPADAVQQRPPQPQPQAAPTPHNAQPAPAKPS